jgi:3-dehydroquinate synthase
MKTVYIDLGERSYDIRIASGILGNPSELLPWISGNQVMVITNEVVAPLYLDTLKKSLEGKDVVEVILGDGESTKSLSTAETIFDRMLQVPLDRTATVVALGGGVIGDMAGFTAACYQRGIPFVQIPTTLLSQVDSSVGGKTGVNHPMGKNMIGAFYQPQRVLIDISVLSTLEPAQFSSGMAEVIKYGLINAPDFFEWLENNLESVLSQNPEDLEYVIEQSCLNKARVVELDEREGGVRALLNLGHTFGHAIETATGYGAWLHGEGVALGMVMAMYMSMEQDWVEQKDYDRACKLIERCNLPVKPSADFCAQEIKKLMGLDKKVQAGKLRLILSRGIGKAFVCDNYDETALDKTLAHFAIG